MASERMERNLVRVTLGIQLLVFPLMLQAGTVGSLTSFSNGTVADAVDVNDNFAALSTAVDDNAARVADLESAGGGGAGFFGAPVVAERGAAASGLAGTLDVVTVPVTMPATGGPYRALVSYGLRGDCGSCTQTFTWVEDDQGGSLLAKRADHNSVGPANVSATEVSRDTYSAGASVTFTLKYGGLINGSIYNADNIGGGENPTWLSVQVIADGSSAGAEASIQHGIIGDCSTNGGTPGGTGTPAFHTFPVPFNTAPTVLLTPIEPDSSGCVAARVEALTATEFSYRTYSTNGNQTCQCLQWMAIAN